MHNTARFVLSLDASLPVPGFNIQPPTPQTSNLTKSASKFVAKKPAQDLVVKSQEWLSEKGDDTGRSNYFNFDMAAELN